MTKIVIYYNWFESMDKNNFFSKYIKNGYFITKPLLSKENIISLRRDLDEELTDYKEGNAIGIERIKNQKLLEEIIKLFASDEIRHIYEEAEIFLKKKIFILPIFQIHKNNHVNLKEFIGWHADCGGETKYNYCKNILYDKKYFFSKIGIYLQKNNEYGGGIDVIKLSHKHYIQFNKFTPIIEKIKNTPYRLIRGFHKKFTYLYNLIPEKVFMFLLGAKKLSPEASSAIIFDSRIIHRGSPIEKNKLENVTFVKGSYLAEVPKDKAKYTLYCHFGTVDALDSYFYDRLKRKDNSSELSMWLKQIEIVKKIDKGFGEKMEEILNPIKQKYSTNI